MSKKTKLMLYISILYSFILVAFLAYGIYQVKVQGDVFDANRLLIAEQNSKELAYHNLIQTTESTKEDRATIEQFFITEKDTISFITDIEQLASKMGITLETSQLSVNPKTDKSAAQLYAGFKFTGQEKAIKQLVLLFENIPYHKTIPELVLTHNPEDGTWKGSILLYITITP
ncbi:hypothetical protein A2592_00540 [Candidatus Kaiserbacteria bacterium RIFOXYD1_FULL_42_15]|uniref:Uncharacterized protein n=1 Tax=Candidatus Kaiserbacteria bacterium RIFOXYD1_FULL_42_15 TaxID=1798532 RepID=A0A1F6FTH7_9BACT|nr:MAG: hypothetical protein A2592_00540 [Candidatus Kaiserbacteria bacterium RIFOXYD1_FULL_42_15]